MRTFDLRIVAVEKTIYEGTAVSCTVTTPDGRIGLEAYHEPFLAVLRDDSDVTYTDTENRTNTVRVGGGLLSFMNNECRIVIG